MQFSEIKISPNLGNHILSLGFGLLILFTLSGSFSFWWVREIQQIPALRYSAIFSLVVIILGLLLNRKFKTKFELSSSGFALSLLLLFFSDWLTRRYSFLPGPEIRGEIFLFWFFAFCLWSQLKSEKLQKGFAFFCIFLVAISFLRLSDGRLLISDDHSVFFYRLSLLKENFPNIPLYNTLWAAGRDTMHLFATGTLNFFFIFYPIIFLLSLESTYTFLVAFLLFGLVPFSVFMSARMLRLKKTEAAISAVLSLSASSLWYLWGLKYGTLGFLTSSTLSLIVFALIVRAFTKQKKFSFVHGFFLAVCTALMLLWSPSGFILFPAILFAILRIRQLLKRTWFLLAVVFVSVVSLPWITLFWSDWNVTNFLSNSSKPFSDTYLIADSSDPVNLAESKTYRFKNNGLDLTASLEILRETAMRTNPLILFIAVPSMFLLHLSSRYLFVATAAWLLFSGAILAPLIPQLELDRMLIILTLFLTIPVGKSLLLFLSRDDLLNRILGSFLVGVTISGVIATTAIVSNRSLDQFSFKNSDLDRIVEFVETNSANGRVLFSGFVLHDLNGGHLAPLAMMSETPMLASSHLHDKWKYEQIFPDYFLNKGITGVLEYLKLHNVGLVAAHESKWRDYFEQYPKQFIPLERVGKFKFYKLSRFESDYFLNGDGEILSQNSSGIKLIPKSKNLVLKFSYYPWLELDNCELGKMKKSGIDFIALNNCKVGSEVHIKSPSFVDRLKRVLK